MHFVKSLITSNLRNRTLNLCQVQSKLVSVKRANRRSYFCNLPIAQQLQWWFVHHLFRSGQKWHQQTEPHHQVEGRIRTVVLELRSGQHAQWIGYAYWFKCCVKSQVQISQRYVAHHCNLVVVFQVVVFVLFCFVLSKLGCRGLQSQMMRSIASLNMLPNVFISYCESLISDRTMCRIVFNLCTLIVNKQLNWIPPPPRKSFLFLKQFYCKFCTQMDLTTHLFSIRKRWCMCFRLIYAGEPGENELVGFFSCDKMEFVWPGRGNAFLLTKKINC